MPTSHPLQGRPDAAQLRKAAGKYLKKLREDAGLTQQEASAKLGLKYYTLISQVEIGKTGFPQERLKAYAKLLGVDRKQFGVKMMEFYAPDLWDLQYGPEDSPEDEGTSST